MQSFLCARNNASGLFVLHIIVVNGWRVPLLVAGVCGMDTNSVVVSIEKGQSVFPFEKLDTHLKHLVMTFLDISNLFVHTASSTTSEHNSDYNEGASGDPERVAGQCVVERGN